MSSVGSPIPSEFEQTPESSNVPNTATPAAAAVTKSKKKRLASDVIGQLEDKLKEDSLDITSWLELIKRIEQKDKIEQVRETYEAFLKIFPFLSTQWIGYIDYELIRGEFDKVEEIFKRCLVNVSSVALWKTYVNYIRRKSNLITGGEDARRVIFQSYDIAVNKVGIDPESGSLWEEYLKFVDDWKPISKWDEQQKMDMKRKIYRKALAIPLDNLEKLWSDYTTFENDLNTTTARKFISEISGAYMNARSWFKEWSNLTNGLKRDASQLLNTNPHTYDTVQLNKWRRWISWELSNKLELEKNVLIERVDYVYKQAIQSLIFYPEIWFEYSQFYKENDQFFSILKVQELLAESLLVNPSSFALNFRLIELYQLDKNITLVKKTFDKLIEYLSNVYAIQNEEIEELKKTIINEETLKKQPVINGDGTEENKPLTDEEQQYIIKSNVEIQSKLSALKQLAKTISLTYCQYIKTAKKLEGLNEARAVFKVCRLTKKNIITHHVFVEAGYLEYSAEKKSKIALNVFELGLRPSFFGNDGEYIYKYLKFLIKINDDTNAKSLFETTVNTKKDLIESKWLKKIFKTYIRFESNFDQLSSIEKLERKYFEFFPDDEKILLFADRYSFNEEGFEDFQIEDDLIRFHDLKQTANDNYLTSKASNGNKRKVVELANDDSEYNNGAKRLHGEENGHNNGGSDVDGSDHINPSKNGILTFDSDIEGRRVIDEDTEQLGGKELVTDEIYNLLRILPSASYFGTPLFNNSKLIKLLKELN